MTRPISADRPSATPDTARSAGNDARIDDDVHQDPVVEDRAQAMVERILARHGTAIQAGAAEPLAHDGDQLDAEERAALRRISGLSTELDDVTDVEYRALRLERVILVGMWNEGTLEDAENSLRELAALAERSEERRVGKGGRAGWEPAWCRKRRLDGSRG